MHETFYATFNKWVVQNLTLLEIQNISNQVVPNLRLSQLN